MFDEEVLITPFLKFGVKLSVVLITGLLKYLVNTE